jgi:hypothetical protein
MAGILAKAPVDIFYPHKKFNSIIKSPQDILFVLNAVLLSIVIFVLLV